MQHWSVPSPVLGKVILERQHLEDQSESEDAADVGCAPGDPVC